MSDKNKLLVLGAPFRLPINETCESLYKRSGNNLGNLLIGNGIVSCLRGYEYVTIGQFTEPEEVNEKCCRIVIAAANFLWKGFDLGFMADFIEKTTIPVTIIGLGAQTNDRSIVSPVHPNTIRLVKILSERSHSLGVRGYYTAEVLAANGILNIDVIGCPSLYTKINANFDSNFQGEFSLDDIVVNFSRRVSSHSFDPGLLKKIDNALLKIAIKYNSKFVAQDEIEEMSIYENKNLDKKFVKPITTYFSDVNDINVINFFKRNTKFFNSVDAWSGFIRKRTGSIGSRLHGSIISLINGVPSLTIAHDSRTLEMLALIGAPYIHVNEFRDVENQSDFLIEKFQSANYNKFKKNFGVLFERYKKFLNNHSLKHKL